MYLKLFSVFLLRLKRLLFDVLFYVRLATPPSTGVFHNDTFLRITIVNGMLLKLLANICPKWLFIPVCFFRGD